MAAPVSLTLERGLLSARTTIHEIFAVDSPLPNRGRRRNDLAAAR
jgi:hypothetical protein